MKLVGRLPMPDKLNYDYMQLNRFLPKETLRDLESEKIFTSAFTKLVNLKMSGDLREVLIGIYWEEYNKEELHKEFDISAAEPENDQQKA